MSRCEQLKIHEKAEPQRSSRLPNLITQKINFSAQVFSPVSPLSTTKNPKKTIKCSAKIKVKMGQTL